MKILQNKILHSKIRKWEVLNEEDISPSKWFKLSKEKVKLPNGKIDDYFVQKLGDVVMIFAVNSKDEAIFVSQYKHGAREITLELPAGRMGENCNPIDEAMCEFKEETGYEANQLEFLCKLITEPSKSNVRVHCYFTDNINFVGDQKFDDTEEIEVIHIPISEIDKWIIDGRIVASDTLAVIKIVQSKFADLFKRK